MANILKAGLAEERIRRKTSLLSSQRIAGSLRLDPLFSYLEDHRIPAYLFGGLLRDFALRSDFKSPRDIDIVTDRAVTRLAEDLSDHLVKKNRFGGLKLRFHGHDVDLWALASTWAFKENLVAPATVERLPRTTFLNLDAVAIELFPLKKSGRKIYEHGFFDGINRGVLEINLRENPYPELCVIRSLVVATETGFSFGPQLADYLVTNLEATKPELLEHIQQQHYGRVKNSKDKLAEMKDLIVSRWPEYTEGNVNINDGQLALEFEIREKKHISSKPASKVAQSPAIPSAVAAISTPSFIDRLVGGILKLIPSLRQNSRAKRTRPRGLKVNGD